MPEDCHAVFKAYCAFVGKTMSEVLLDFAKSQVHKQGTCCTALQTLFDVHEMSFDARSSKPCFGYRCLYCEHETSCRVGIEDKLFIMAKRWHPYLKPSHAYIKDFDGSSIDCCKPEEVFDIVNWKKRNS